MVDRNLLREFNVSDDELTAQFKIALGDDYPALDEDGSEVDPEYDFLYHEIVAFDPGTIVSGKVIRIEGDDVLIDVGYKSEGVVPLEEWRDVPEDPEPGMQVEVLLEEFEDQYGLLLL